MARNPALTAEQRLAIVRQSDKVPEWKQKQLGEWAAETFKLDFVPSQPTISIVLRQGGKPVKVRVSKKKKKEKERKPKVVKCPQVDRAMLQWLEMQIEKDEAVTVAKVQAKALELVQQLKVTVTGFAVSQSWVDSFMRHHVLQCPFGLSDEETTDTEEPKVTMRPSALAKRAGKTVKSAEAKAAGKTSRRVVKLLAEKKDPRMPSATTVVAPVAGKRKRDAELETPVEARRQVKTPQATGVLVVDKVHLQC